MSDALIQLLTKNEDRVVVSSKQVAIAFEKQHKNVLRAIENIKKDWLKCCQEPNDNDSLTMDEFNSMFYQTTAPDSYGREQKIYLMDVKGATFLAFGFRGKKALQWKQDYIKEFNRMKQRLEELYILKNIQDPIEQALAYAKMCEQRRKAVK